MAQVGEPPVKEVVGGVDSVLACLHLNNSRFHPQKKLCPRTRQDDLDMLPGWPEQGVLAYEYRAGIKTQVYRS